MAETNGEKLLSEMDQFLTDEAQKNASAETADEALPFETIDDYSTAPVEFGEMTQKLMVKVDAVFDLAVKYNRHSSAYLKSCTKLEKGITYLARCCRTKYALEICKHQYPELGQLTTDKLYRMASFHYRKIDRALTEYIEQKQDVSDELIDMQFRYFNLLDRLRATEVKIRHDDNNYYSDHVNYDAVIHGLAFSPDSWTRTIHREHNDQPAAFHRARAFSPLREKSEESGMKKEASANTDGNETSGQKSGLSEQNGQGTNGQETVISGQKGQEAGSKDPDSLGMNLTTQKSEITPQISDPLSHTSTLPSQISFEKQAKLNALSETEMVLYTLAIQKPDVLTEMREKVNDVYYCCDHQDEARAILKVLGVIDST